MQKGIHDLEL